MGQYYKPVLRLKGSADVKTYHAHQFDNGLKLTEHSWIGNNLCNQVYNQILDNPHEVAWVGDYAKFEDVKNEDFKGEALFKKIYQWAWKKEDKFDVKPDRELQEFDFGKQWYLVNNTKGVFLDLTKFIKKNTIEDGWCLSPLSLLTAIGNGKGGGDYWGINKESVGIWAFDEIYISESKPERCLEDEFEFKE